MKRIVDGVRVSYLACNMLNDTSSILSLLQTRRSGKPRELVGSGPTDAELRQMLTIAVRTPDHGNLSPWRFVIVGVDQRDAFDAVLQGALRQNEPDAPSAKIEKEHAFSHYQGALVVLISAPVPDHKIPVWEQELSCGAAAMNLLLAAHAFGYVPGWVTGWRAYSDTVRHAFCRPGERIAGFIFIGRETRELEDRPRPPLDAVVSNWQPPN